MTQENMELCSSFTTSSPKFICHQTNDNPDIHLNNIALEETTYNGRLANDGNENSNNNDGIVASSAEPFLLPTHKYDNVSEVSHLSASSCETLLVSYIVSRNKVKIVFSFSIRCLNSRKILVFGFIRK